MSTNNKCDCGEVPIQCKYALSEQTKKEQNRLVLVPKQSFRKAVNPLRGFLL